MGLIKKTYENIINLTAGFRYRAEKPIDDRLVVDDYNSLNELVNNHEAYKGMIVSVINDADNTKNGTYHYIKRNDDIFKWYKLEIDASTTDDIIIMNGGNANDDERYIE